MASAERRLLALWWPTALGASMLVLEIPIVYAAAARSTGGPQVLAAMGICVAILVVVNSPGLAITPLAVTAHGRHSWQRLRRQALLTGLAAALVLVALATLPPLVALVRLAFDPDAVLLGHIRAGLLGLAPNALGVALRRYMHGRLIVNVRTRPIASATALRILGTLALAWAGTALWPQHGALVAGLALSAGAFTEAACLAMIARALPREPPPGPSPYIELIRRHADVSAARLLVMAPMLVTTIAVAHSAHSAASLVVWPALYELAMLFASPTSDWESVAAGALRKQPRGSAPRRVTVRLAAAFTCVLVLVLATGPAHVYLRGLLAVPAELASFALTWSWLLVPVPALWLVRGYLRGAVMAAVATGWLTAASLAHGVALLACATALAATTLPGLAVAGAAVVAGLSIDVAMTGYGAFRSSTPGPAVLALRRRA
ncbi:hypothetical protein [Nonomuraea rubra]|uniref:hypothetical protein n=1 Tax=Nonomuraea rubra TaxID=46180 RepID=UPI0033DD81AA